MCCNVLIMSILLKYHLIYFNCLMFVWFFFVFRLFILKMIAPPIETSMNKQILKLLSSF